MCHHIVYIRNESIFAVGISPDSQFVMAKIVLLACTILLADSAQGCFFLDIECKIKESIQKVGSELIGKAEQAFEQAMDHVFDQDISPLLDKAIAAIDAGIDKVDKDVNETINHIESSIEAIIQDAAQTANALASNVTHDIEEIIRKATTAMEQVENTFYKDASNLLSQINQIVQKGQCMEASGAKQIQDQLYKLLKSLDPYYRVSSCWRSLGHKISMTLEDLTDIQLYNYQKECTLLNKVTPNTPIEGPGGILETYAQGQLYAAEYYCIGETANAPAFQDVLSKEWLWWGVQYNAWKHIATPPMERSVQGSAVRRVKDDPCGTPVECYAKAIKALEEAEQKILTIQTGLSDLNQTVKQVNGSVQTGLSSLSQTVKQVNASLSQTVKQVNSRLSQTVKQVNASIIGLETNVSVNTQAISTNAKAIATGSTLVSYPCDCSIDSDQGSLCSSDRVSAGYGYICHHWGISTHTSVLTGIRCCRLCSGTAEEAAAYAQAHPPPSLQRLGC